MPDHKDTSPGPYGAPVADDPASQNMPSPTPVDQHYAEARIYRRSAVPVQKGPAHIGEWILEFEPAASPGVEPLMGWISSQDVLQQIRLTFDCREAAEAYCRKEGLAYTVQEPAPSRQARRTYADNYIPFEDGTPRPIYPH